jgi:phosphatidylglycerophosphate synthase
MGFMMTILQEYRNSLKMQEVEEPLDLFFYRPIAFVIVKLIYRLPITPNQVTFLSLGAGLVSAYYFAQGTLGAFVVAAVWYAISNVLDCCDGMLARLQGSGTPLGRLIDGIGDWIIAVAIFLGLGIGLTHLTQDPTIWYLVVAGGITSALHAIAFDYHQQDYVSHVRGKESYHTFETDKTRRELQQLKDAKGSWLRRGVLLIYLQYLTVQERVQTQPENQRRQYAPEVFRKHNRRIMRWWTLLGSTTNRSLLIVTALFGAPILFLWIVVTAGNMYLLFMLLQQRSIKRRMEALAH